MTSRAVNRIAKPLLFATCLLPLAQLMSRAWQGDLGVNPIETVTHATGDWTLRFVLITLAVTPLRRFTGWNRVIAFRRMLGLFAFFYASLHLLTYVWLDQFFAWRSILHDIPRRPFITVGFAAFVLLVPLAATSTTGAIRRLGGRRWRRLHQLIYVVALFGVTHYWWLVKADIRLPATYACLLAILLATRLWFWTRKTLAESASAAARRLRVEEQ